MFVTIAVTALFSIGSESALAQRVSASGAVGGGTFGSDAAAAAELGLDVSGERYSVGLGGRLQWVNQSGLRTDDWDTLSEWVTLIRYVTYIRLPPDDDGVRATVAIGALGDASLGHGSVIQGFATGLDVDHRRTGAQVRLANGRFGFEALVDDVAAPRVVGGRGSWAHELGDYELIVAATAAADFSAPRVERSDSAMVAVTTNVLPMAVIDGSLGRQFADESGRYRLAGTLYSDLVAIETLAAGAHSGLLLAGSRDNTQVTMRAELQFGTDSYLANWVGPMYERDRGSFDVDAPRSDLEDAPMTASTQLDRAHAGDLGGLTSRYELAITQGGVGELALAYQDRGKLPSLATLRLSAPYRAAFQGALWAAIEPAGGARTFAAELRAQLPQTLFLRFDMARRYRYLEARADDPKARTWLTAMLSVGASLDMM